MPDKDDIWRLYPEYEVFADGRDALAREPDLRRRAVLAEHDDAAHANNHRRISALYRAPHTPRTPTGFAVGRAR
jgi:hypothetical protein